MPAGGRHVSADTTTFGGQAMSCGRVAVGTMVAWLREFALAPGRLSQLVRYTMVSAAALVVDLAVFAAIMASGVLAASLAGAVSVLAGLVVHYVMSTRFVFDVAATAKSRRRLVGEYGLTGLLGFVVTWVAIVVVVDLAGLPAGLGKLAGVGATFVTVYVVRAGLVFKPASSNSGRLPRAG